MEDMSYVKPHNIMRNITLRNITASFAALFSLLFASLTASAQTVYSTYYTGDNTTTFSERNGSACRYTNPRVFFTGGVIYVSAMPGSEMPSRLSVYTTPQSIYLYSVDADGNETEIDHIDNSNATNGVSPHGWIGVNTGFIRYKMNMSSQVYGGGVGSGSRLSDLKVVPEYYNDTFINPSTGAAEPVSAEEYQGTTMLVRVNFGSRINTEIEDVVEVYFDPIGGQFASITTFTDKSPENLSRLYDDDPTWAYFAPCPDGHPVEMSIEGVDYPYLAEGEKNYLGNSYSVKYAWFMEESSWGGKGVYMTDTKVDTRTFYDTTTTSQKTSGQIEYKPQAYVFCNGEYTGCSVELGVPYTVYLYQPLEVYGAFENTGGATESETDSKSIDKFYACYGDDVTYTPTFKQDIDGVVTTLSANVYWALYEVDDDGNILSTVQDFSDYEEGDNIVFSNVTETKRYKLVAEYADDDDTTYGGHHRKGDMSEHPCPTEKFFTIEVRQVSATTTFTLPDAYVCENSDPEISVTVSNLPEGDTGADYAYRWYYSDDAGATLYDFNTTGYLHSGDADWVDPTTTVKNIYKNINVPTASAANSQKLIRFLLANTYVVDGAKYYCPIEDDVMFTVYYRPILDAPNDTAVCQDQPLSFKINLYDYSTFSSSIPYGMTYEIYHDEACTNSARDEVITLYGDEEGNNRKPAPEEYNAFRTSYPSLYMWWGIEKAHPSDGSNQYVYYARVKNEETGCYSLPVKKTINVLPQPELTTVNPDPTSFCLNGDTKDLKVTTALNTNYSGYDFDAVGASTGDLTYHWSWYYPEGGLIDSTSVVNSPELSGVFNDNKVSTYVGDVKFQVYATDGNNCGYQLDYDGSVIAGSNNIGQTSLTPAEGVVKINEKPDFSIDLPDTESFICANSGSVTIPLASNDSRKLQFTITPKDGTNVTTNSPVVVNGLSTADFIVNFDESAVDDDQKFEFTYTVLDLDNLEQTCDSTSEFSFVVYERPQLNPVSRIFACAGQPVQLDLSFAGNIPVPTAGLTYKVYSDAACTSELGSLCKLLSSSDSKTTATTVSYSMTALFTQNTGLQTVYAQVTDERTGCKSDALPIEFVVTPQPLVDYISFSQTEFCRYDDPSSLVATAHLNGAYTSFDYASFGASVPSVTYHWAWTDGKLSNIGSSDVVDNENLTNSFSGLTAEVGNPNFTVYVTNDSNCGYVLDDHGNVTSSKTSVETTIPSASIKVYALPYPYIESGVTACANEGVVRVAVGSNDERSLALTFTPQSADNPAATTTLSVPANSKSTNFEATLDASKITDITTFTYDVHAAGYWPTCGMDTVLSFTVYPVPVVAISPADGLRNVCQGESLELTASPSITENGAAGVASRFSYRWLDGTVEVGTSKSFTWQTETTTATGVHYLTLETSYRFADGHVCTTTSTIDVYVDPLPEFTFGTDQTICEGETATLFAEVTNASAYNHSEWTKPNDFKVEILPNSGVTTTKEYDYRWSFAVSPVTTQEYSIRVTNTFTGCAPKDYSKVTVNVERKAHFRVTALSETEVCEGNHEIEVSISPVNASEFTSDWSTLVADGFTVVSASDSKIVISGYVSATGGLSSNGKINIGSSIFKASTAAGCEVVFDNDLVLTVNSIPDAPGIKYVASSNGQEYVCQGQDQFITVMPANIANPRFSYEWFVSDSEPNVTDKGEIKTSTGRFTVYTRSLTASTKIWVRAIDTTHPATKCPSAFSFYEIVVNPVPAPSYAVNQVCEGDKGTITITSPLNDATHTYTYNFFSSDDTNNPLQSGSSNVYETENLNVSTNYYISVAQNETGCTSDPLLLTVTVNKKPVGVATVAYQDALGNTTITDPLGNSINRTAFCEGESGKAIITLVPTMQTAGTAFTSNLVSVSEGNVYDWSKDSEGQWSCPSTYVWNNDVTLTFDVTDATTGCVSDNFSVTVLVKPGLPAPVIKINDDAKEVCYDEAQDITVELASTYSYSSANVQFVYYMLDKNTGAILAGPIATKTGTINGSTTSFNIKDNVYFHAYAYDAASGCMSPVSNDVDITVNQLPVPTISVSADKLCPGETATLTVNETYVSYLWLDGQTRNMTTQSVDVTLDKTQSFRVQVTDDKGCESLPVSTTITVFPRPSFTLAADPSTVCQGSNDDVIIKITPENDLDSSASEKVEFENAYTFTTIAPGTGVVTTRTNADGETEYVVTGHTWTEATESFSATIRSTSDYNSCLSDVETVTVYVVGALPKPDAYTTAPQDGSKTKDVHICEETTDPLTVYIDNIAAYPTAGNIVYSYHWYSDAAGTNELVSGSDYTVDYSKGTIKFVPKSNVTLYAKAVRETEPNCSSELSEVVKITMESLPVAPVANEASKAYVCQPEDKDLKINLTVLNPASDNKYHWYTADGTKIGVAQGTEPFVIDAPSETTSYYVITESVYGCFSDVSNTIEIKVSSNPVIVALTAPTSDICSGESVSMSVGVEGSTEGITFQYVITSSNPASTLATTGVIDNSGDLNTSALTVSETETLTFTFNAVYGGTCLSLNNVQYTVTVHAYPTFNSDVVTPNPVCEGEDLSFLLSGVTSHDGSATLKQVRIVDVNGNVLVSQDNVVSGSNVSFELDKTVLPNGITRDYLPLTYEIEDAHCTLSQQVGLDFNDIPDFDIESKDGGVERDGKINFCRNNNIRLGLVAELPATDKENRAITYTYQWKFNGGNISGAVNPELSISGITPSESGVYSLVVTTWRDGVKACEYSRSLDIVVNELPEAEINGEHIFDYYCTDGVLDLYGNENMMKYVWTIESNPAYSLTKTYGDADFDNHIRVSFADLNISTNDIWLARLVITDENGCESLEAQANFFTAVPPVINAVYGTEACEDKAFVITVDQDKSDYEFELYESDGVTLVPNCVYNAADHSLVTPTDLPEGDYVIRVKDTDTNCTTDKEITLTRYDIVPVFELLPDPTNRFYCYNGLVAFDVTLEENNGHDDFFEKIEDVQLTLDYTYNNVSIRTDVPVTITPNRLHVEFNPNDPAYNLTPSDVPYTIFATVSYKFKTDINGYLSCDGEGQQNIRIVEVPVIETEPALPVCLDTDIKFIVGTDNLTAPAAKQSFIFYVNGEQVINANGDYSSNIFDTAEHPEIDLKEGDQVTVTVVMDEYSNSCTSEPVVVSFKGDFSPEIENINSTDYLCLGQDITFDIVSKRPASVTDDSFVLRAIKSYNLFIVDSKGETQYGSTVDVSSSLPLTTPASVKYDGEDSEIRIYALVTDEDDCEVKTNEVTVKINQFKIVDIVVTNENGDVMNTDDLCADIDYTYTAIIHDGDGNVITPGSDYDFTFTFDGVEWSDHSAGNYLFDYVKGPHAVTDGYITMTVNVINLITGCKTDATLNLYKPYSENFKFHAKPDPQEKLNEGYLPVDDTPANARVFEICADDDFSMTMNGSIVTIIANGVKVATYTNGTLSETIDESVIATSQIKPSYDAASGQTTFNFTIEPNMTKYQLSYIVSDGTCEVETDVWQFMKYGRMTILALDEQNVDRNVGGVVTLCQGESVDFTPEMDYDYTDGYNFYLDGQAISTEDFKTLVQNYVATTVGTYELIVKFKSGRADCYNKLTIEVKEAPVPAVDFGGITPDAVVPETEWTFSVCEETDVNMVLSGAEAYTITSAVRGGDNVIDQFVTSGQGAAFSQNVNLQFVGTGDYCTYVLNVLYEVGNCSKTATININVYNNPEAEFINNTPKSLVIAGTEVPVDVTPGYANYEFKVDGVTVQNGSSSSLAGSDNVMTTSATIEVVVTNAFGCQIAIKADVKVLEGIEAKTIVASSDYYCSEDEGVSISVVEPQDGVTYEIESMSNLQPITCVDGSAVVWEPVRLSDPANVNPQTFAVVAYYESLPDQKFYMANTVTVEEVTSPVDATAPTFTATNCAEVQSPTFVWTVTGADPSNTYWLVDANGNEYGPITTTSSTFNIEVYNILNAALGSTPNGEYHIVARTKRQYGDNAGQYVCEKVLDGVLTIDIPTTNSYDVLVNPANGNICIDDLEGVDVYITASDYDPAYAHQYVLYQDGVEIARKSSTAAGGEIRFSNLTLPGVGTYKFTVVCEFNGCSTAMNNAAVVNVYAAPENQTLSVDNDGYFCYDAAGATITVGGQQEGYLYKLYRNGADTWTAKDATGSESTVSYSHIGDASGAPFTFENITAAGTYTVKVFIPDLERYETSCVTELEGTVEVKPIAEPTQPDAHIAKVELGVIGSDEVTVCIDEQVRVTLLQPEAWDLPDFEVHYKLYDENGNLLTQTEVENLSNSNKVVFNDFSAEDVNLEAGEHKITVIATQTRVLSDGSKLECEQEFPELLTLNVKNRPSDGSEYLTVDDAVASDDPCYGVDIVINNPNTSAQDEVEYILYLIDNTTGTSTLKRISSIKPYLGDEPRFTDIRNGKGDYQVVAYNGACSDIIKPDPIHVEQDKYAQVQVLDVEDFMCQGDPGVSVGLMDSEANVIYRLYYIQPSDYVKAYTQQELIDEHPGIMISEYNKATFDHQRVIFSNLDYQDGKVSDLLRKDGYYYVVSIKDTEDACPVASPVTNFQSLKLPKSFNLMENRVYCDDKGVELYVEHSELDPTAKITYMLYKKDDAGNLTYIGEVESDGSDMLKFKDGSQDLFVTEGTYAAIAIKEYTLEVDGQVKNHICTSALATEVVVKPGESLDKYKFDDVEIVICNSETAEFSVPDSSLGSDVKYYLTDENGDPQTAAIQEFSYGGNGDVTFTKLVDGVNVIWASYVHYDCLVELGKVTVSRHPAIPENVINETVCGENGADFAIDAKYLVDGVTYYLKDADGNVVAQQTYDAATGSTIEFHGLEAQTYEIYGAFGGVAGECETYMGLLAAVNPAADVILYVNGAQYKSGDEIEICAGLPSMVTITPKNVSVTTYNFYWKADGSVERDLRYSGSNNTWIFTDELKGHSDVVLSFSIETVCGEYELTDTFTIHVKGSTVGENHLFAKDGIVDYCAGYPVVKLGYDAAVKGETYRLYKVTGEIDPENNVYDDELMDIQEIPRNIENPSNILYFNGWGYFDGTTGDSKLYASAGCYYVDITESNGCSYTTDLLCVTEHPSPIAEGDSAFYVFVDPDTNIADFSTQNFEYGVLDGKFGYATPVVGYKYTLVKDGEIVKATDDNGVESEISITPTEETDYITFGFIKDYKQDADGNTLDYIYMSGDSIFSGEGLYSVLVESPYCSVYSNEVTFVEEELVAYNVEIYLNKNEVSRIVDLIPRYVFNDGSNAVDGDEWGRSHKSNHKYIGWSSKIDRIYYPKVISDEDGYYINDATETQLINKTEDPDYFRDGYTNVKGTYSLSSGASGRKVYTGKSGASNVWFNLLPPEQKINGSYGFVNVDYTPSDSSVISTQTPTGYFFYMKQPSFYGREVLEYYIENYQMPGRKSNTATITILCGNEETGDESSVFLIPNAFSPNGDGLNDYFKIIIPDMYLDNSESKLQVFNRWGTLVYRSSGLRYGENDEWWDGTSSTSNMVTVGNKLPSGTYYYVFTITFIDKVHATKSERKMHGYIELRR